MRSILISLGMAPLAVVAFTANTPAVAPEMTESVDSRCQEIHAIGRIEGATPEIEIHPRMSGRIETVLVRPGQFVEPGQLLLHLDDRQYRQDVTIAAAQLDGAEAQLQRLHDGARGERRAELAALCRAKEAELDVAHARLGRIRKLGQAGVVAEETVDQPEARVIVEEKDAVRVSAGMKARIVADGVAGYQFRGRVTRVRPRMEPKRFWSDDPAERFDVDTREIWIALETTEPPLVGVRVRVILDTDPRVDTDTESAGLASLG